MKLEIFEAVHILRSGGLVAFPTETVYGLGADAQNEAAVRRIFAAKGRPPSHPLIVHLGDPSQLDAWASSVSQTARELARRFWPGALTLVVKRSALASDVVTGGQDTVGLRVPASPLAQLLLKAFGNGIAAPSANRYGRVSPTTAQDVRFELGNQVDAVLDGGPCAIGVESTIVDVSSGSAVLLRPGGIPREHLERALGSSVPFATQPAVRVPGQQQTHYAPSARIVLADHSELTSRAEEEGGKGLEVVVLAPGKPALPLGVAHLPVPEQLEEFARVLYATLREVDRRGFDVAVVLAPQRSGLGLAIYDRLSRAAGPRSPPVPPGGLG